MRSGACSEGRRQQENGTGSDRLSEINPADRSWALCAAVAKRTRSRTMLSIKRGISPMMTMMDMCRIERKPRTRRRRIGKGPVLSLRGVPNPPIWGHTDVNHHPYFPVPAPRVFVFVFCLTALVLSGCSEQEEAVVIDRARPVKSVVVGGPEAGGERRFPGRVDSTSKAELAFRIGNGAGGPCPRGRCGRGGPGASRAGSYRL